MSHRRSIVRHGAHVKGGTTVDITVNGKRVALRERFPVEEYDDLRGKLQKIDASSNWKIRWDFLHRFIESWEFPGDPHDQAAWGQLDMFSEFAGIENAVVGFMAERGKYAKNSVRPSTTP